MYDFNFPSSLFTQNHKSITIHMSIFKIKQKDLSSQVPYPIYFENQMRALCSYNFQF
jgi:hypothetical protein